MCAWFKRRPRVYCILCGNEVYNPNAGSQTLEGHICPACDLKLDFHTEPEWKRKRTMSRKDLLKQIEIGTQRTAARERKTAAGEYLVVTEIVGLPIPSKQLIIIELLRDKILFTAGVGAQQTNISLPYSRLLGCETNTEYITRDTDASPALRALVGGALLGATGAIAGAASAMNEKYLTAIQTATIKYRTKTGKIDHITIINKKPTQIKPGQLKHVFGPDYDNPYRMLAIACNNKVPRTARNIEL